MGSICHLIGTNFDNFWPFNVWIYQNLGQKLKSKKKIALLIRSILNKKNIDDWMLWLIAGGKQQPAEIKVFAHESMQQALQQVQQVCNDSQKKKFSDLFSLLDNNEEPEVSRGRSTGRGSKRTASRTNNSSSRSKPSNKEESEEESSEEEVIIKKGTKPKRKKPNLVGSDSDWKIRLKKILKKCRCDRDRAELFVLFFFWSWLHHLCSKSSIIRGFFFINFNTKHNKNEGLTIWLDPLDCVTFLLLFSNCEW